MGELTQDVVSRVIGHMNADHADDNLAIVQVNYAANAVRAEMIGLDTEQGVWRATYSDDSTRDVVVPWGTTVETSEDVRKVVVALARAAHEQISGYDPDVIAARHLPEPPPGGWKQAMRDFHEQAKARFAKQ